MLFAFSLLAQAAPDAAPPPGGGLLGGLLPFIPILVLGYFLLLRPARRQEQERQRMLNAVKKNDKVITSGGLIGVVASIKEKEDEVTLKVDESSNLRLRVTKSSIVRVMSPDEPPKETK